MNSNGRFQRKQVDFRNIVAQVEKVIPGLTGKEFNNGVGEMQQPKERANKCIGVPIMDSSKNGSRSMAVSLAAKLLMTQSDMPRRAAV